MCNGNASLRSILLLPHLVEAKEPQAGGSASAPGRRTLAFFDASDEEHIPPHRRLGRGFDLCPGRRVGVQMGGAALGAPSGLLYVPGGGWELVMPSPK